MLTLSKFFVKAKQNTYASAGEREEKILTGGSKELVFKEGNFKYRDRYFGFNPFAGQEVIFRSGQAIWTMNYYGWITSKEIPAKQLYQFLKQALSKVRADKPFRGPENFKKGDFQYQNIVQGAVQNFIGQEQIFYKNKLVYKLYYHGGLIANH